MPEPVVSIKNFTKTFGQNQVVKDLSFEVFQGETFAFLGANGSGKTTTIRCLLDILQPTSGELLIQGKRYSVAMAHQLGYMPEERGLYVDANVLETMTYFGTLKGVVEAEARRWSLDFLQHVGLGDKANQKIKTMSSGQQQKIQLGITIINKPSLLILDEPTKGLDPLNRELLLSSLDEMREHGSTIIFITHQMDEVEKLADRLIMIKDGKRVLYGKLQDVREEFGENRVHVEFEGKFPVNEKLYRIVTAENNIAELVPADGIKAPAIFKFLAGTDVQITKFDLALPSLQEMFVAIQQRPS